MSRSDDERFADILEAAAEIAAIVSRGQQAWNGDRITRLAVERLLEIIGESARSLTAEKVALFRSLFAGRDDVFAQRSESTASGKSGWSPATAGGWAARKAATKTYLPLTDEVIASHLSGEMVVGLYPLLPDDTCRLLVCDFDDDGWALDATAFADACRSAGVPAALERSRSGSGGHAWIFFTTPLSAASARRLGFCLLRSAMAERDIDLTSYDRLFPSQDYLPKRGFGNLIALPLQGASRRLGNSVFLDPRSLQPWDDQWAFLSSIARTTPEAVAATSAALAFETGPQAGSYRLGNAKAISLRQSGRETVMTCDRWHCRWCVRPRSGRA